ncbi:hypothetical protein GCM10009868_28850 [Terrabacter aerolatus]|uniref:Uncharacterized protein n=1 Tax=Terrabacter aerolatus TaxID=422442 RepID=A0A512CXC9_9MICO|nr:hypothetical protein [Terrabacter aerolatus]GEO28872.1 hypothetical protein TAE01_06820 [Terrabacter aerolatus]
MSEKHDRGAPTRDGKHEGQHTAGAFDIRNFIGALLGLYGIILLVMGIFGDQSLDKTGGVNANLYAGIALVVVSAFFVVWARIKPIVVPEHVEPPDDDPVRPAPKRRPSGH